MKNMSVITEPEVLLGSFNKKLWSLYNKCQSLNINKLDDEFIEFAKKSFIAELFYKKYMISVSGTQGVGKTTLIKNLYNIPDGYLPECDGRGEKIPVVITEDDVNSLICRKVSVQISNENSNDLNFEPEEVDKSTFFDGILNPDNNTVYYELIVPKKIFGSKNCSFILLPGIEENNSSHDNFNKYVLDQTANTIYLFYSGKSAQSDDKQLLDKVMQYFKNSNPIFCITFTDQHAEGSRELKNKFIKQYNIEHDRIICVGTENISEWSEELQQSINLYSNIEKVSREKQIKNLSNIMSEELNSLLDKINVQLSIAETKIDKSEETNKIFKIIKKQDDEVRSKVKKSISSLVKNIKNEALKDIKTIISDEKVPLKLKKMILGKSVKEIDKFEQDIMDCWIKHDNSNVLTSAISIVNESETLFHNLGEKDNLLEQKEVTNECLDYYQNTFMDSTDVKYKSTESKRHLKNVPYLANELILLRYEIPQNITISNYQSEYSNTEIDLLEKIEYSSTQRDKIMKSVGVLMGVDLLDGTVNTIPAILGLFGIEISAVASAGIFAGLGVGFLGIQLFKSVNKRDLEDRDLANKAMDNIGNEYSAILIEQYDFLMDKIYERIGETLDRRYNVDKNGSRLIEAQLLLSDIRNIQGDVKEIINEHPFIKK